MLLCQYLAGLRQEAAGPGDLPLLEAPGAGLQQRLAGLEPAVGRRSERKSQKLFIEKTANKLVSTKSKTINKFQ